MIDLLEWSAMYYMEPIGEMVRAAFPPGLVQDSHYHVVLASGTAGDAAAAAGSDGEKVVSCLASKGHARLSHVIKKSGAVYPRLACSLLEAAGIVRVALGTRPGRDLKVLTLAAEPSDKVMLDLYRSSRKTAELLDLLIFRGDIPLQEVEERFRGSADKVKTLCQMGVACVVTGEGEPQGQEPWERKGCGGVAAGFELSEEQRNALEKISGQIGQGFSSYLLHGVTGSGKTEVYLRAAASVLKSGQSVLMLVPEISLTPQLAARLRSRFGREVAVLHSGMREADRLSAWLDAASGVRRVVLGTRSAVFAPISNLGLVVVDEEHEAAYKQEESPRYNGRDLAIKRAQLAGAVAVLGSATPSLESYFNATTGKYTLLSLPERVTGHPLPEVMVLDLGERREMQKERAYREGRSPMGPAGAGTGQPFFLTPRMFIMLHQTLEAGRQSILLLNRRGFSSFVCCRDCGHQFICDQCNVSMTYHKAKRSFVCHYCGLMKPLPGICPGCGGEQLALLGLGTERVEEEILARFPTARVLRLDRDMASDFGEVERILETFEAGDADVLIGTQMVAKGHHFPGVTFVGIVLADIGLSLPDFRAGERLYGLLSQVAGRSGRGEDHGKVLVQTFNPNHYAVLAAQKHDYAEFYSKELDARRELSYPPFSRLIRVVFESKSREGAGETAAAFADSIRRSSGGDADVLGPAPAVIDRVRGSWRYQVLIRGKALGRVKKSARAMLEQGGRLCSTKGVRVMVDVDPSAML
jgi:primosomal protein N' (replication factor Y)